MMRFTPVAAAVASYLALAVSPALCAGAVSVDDTARYLAGMPPSANSPLAPLTKSAHWQQHARTMDRAFAQVEKGTLAPIREWSAAHLSSPQKAMFYMFSGPDFLFADAFFPKASTYVLAALEPVGDIPDVLKQQRHGETVGLGQLQTAMRTLLSISFFITKEMREDISESSLRGTIPVLYVFLARSGKQVRSTSLVYIDAQGDVHPEVKNAKSGAHGVKIVFAGADGIERTLYYFTTNLDNTGARTGGFLKFLDNLGPADSFHKSASYLMHKNEFSRIRDFIVANSATVVQDDSGIPIRYFDAKAWQLRPFGRYLEPLDIFPEGRQPKIRELFEKSSAGKLNFGLGYRWRPGESNLLLAVRRPSAEKAENK